MFNNPFPEIDDVLKAAEKLHNVSKVAPLECNVSLSNLYQADIYLKREDM